MVVAVELATRSIAAKVSQSIDAWNLFLARRACCVIDIRLQLIDFPDAPTALTSRILLTRRVLLTRLLSLFQGLEVWAPGERKLQRVVARTFGEDAAVVLDALGAGGRAVALLQGSSLLAGADERAVDSARSRNRVSSPDNFRDDESQRVKRT